MAALRGWVAERTDSRYLNSNRRDRLRRDGYGGRGLFPKSLRDLPNPFREERGDDAARDVREGCRYEDLIGASHVVDDASRDERELRDEGAEGDRDVRGPAPSRAVQEVREDPGDEEEGRVRERGGVQAAHEPLNQEEAAKLGRRARGRRPAASHDPRGRQDHQREQGRERRRREQPKAEGTQEDVR